MPKAGPSARADIMQMLGSLRVATTTQVRALVTPGAASAGYVRRALRALAADGLVQGTAVGWAHEQVWYLTSAGARAAAVAAGRDVPRRPPITAAMVASGLLRHALAVTATAAAFAAGGIGNPADWSLEVVHRYGQSAGQWLRTDAVLRTERGDWPRALLVELDRNTLPINRLLGEVRAYRAYAARREPARRGRIGIEQRWERDYLGSHRCPPLLFVLTGGDQAVLDRRAARLRALARLEAESTSTPRHLRHDGLDVGVVLLADLVEHGPNAPIVLPFDENRWIPVDELARPRPQPAPTTPVLPDPLPNGLPTLLPAPDPWILPGESA